MDWNLNPKQKFFFGCVSNPPPQTDSSSDGKHWTAL